MAISGEINPYNPILMKKPPINPTRYKTTMTMPCIKLYWTVPKPTVSVVQTTIKIRKGRSADGKTIHQK